MADSTKNIVYNISVRSDDGKVRIDGLTKGFVNAETAVKRLNKDLALTQANIDNSTKSMIGFNAQARKTGEAFQEGRRRSDIAWAGINKNTAQATKNMGQMTDKTGLAGAAVVELGRTISDSNYGFTAMANNISQLATLMTTLIVTTGGVANGLRAMWTALMGPLGVIVAFQGIVALLERYSMQQKRAREATDEATKSMRQQSKVVEFYTKQLKDTNTTLEEQTRILKELSEVDENYGKIIKQTEGDVDSRNEAIIAYNKLLLEQNSLEANRLALGTYLVENEEEYRTAVVDLANANRELLDAQEDLQEGAQEGSGLTVREIHELRYAVEDAEESVEEAEEALKPFNDAISNLNSSIEMSREGIELYNIILKQLGITLDDLNTPEALPDDLLSEVEKAQYELNLLAARGARERNRIVLEEANKQIEIRLKAYEDLINARTDLGEEERALLISQARQQADDLRRITEETIRRQQFNEDETWFYRALGIGEGLNTAEIEKIVKESIDLVEKSAKRILEERNQGSPIMQGGTNFLKELLGGNDMVTEAVAMYADAMSSIFDFVDSEYQRSLDSTQAYYTEQNNMLRQQLENENLGADERAKIQKQIYDNDEKSRKQQEEIQKKRFKANKAFAIAEATVNTFLAATQVLTNPDVTGILKIAQAAAVISFGLAQVAMISRQKYVPSASSVPPAAGAGGGAGSEGRDINYNLIGDSGINQLTQTIQDAFDKPIKAYVTSRDMTNQQELDLAIETEATI